MYRILNKNRSYCKKTIFYKIYVGKFSIGDIFNVYNVFNV